MNKLNLSIGFKIKQFWFELQLESLNYFQCVLPVHSFEPAGIEQSATLKIYTYAYIYIHNLYEHIFYMPTFCRCIWACVQGFCCSLHALLVTLTHMPNKANKNPASNRPLNQIVWSKQFLREYWSVASACLVYLVF